MRSSTSLWAVAVTAVMMLPVIRASDCAQTGCAPEGFTAWAVNRGENALFLASAVDIHISLDLIELNDYATEPVRLTDVRTKHATS